MHKKKHKRPWMVFLAIILAVFFGSWAGKDTAFFGLSLYSLMDILGSIFLNALTLLVVPLVASSIITGISRIGSEGDFGRLGGKMFFFYIGTSLLAILIGLFFVNLIQPGSVSTLSGMEIPNLQSIQQNINEGDTARKV